MGSINFAVCSISKACVLSLMVLPAGVIADEPSDTEVTRIEPDRRDFATGTGIVSAGSWQIESGLTWDEGPSEHEFSTPVVTVRIPLLSNLEAHVVLPTYVISRDAERSTGFDDSALEMRYRFVHGSTFGASLQATLVLPTGARAVAERDFQPGAILAASLKLSPSIDWITSVSGGRVTVRETRFAQFTGATSVRLDVTESWSISAELYVFNREEADGTAHRYIDLGSVYFLGKSTALDARIGKGIQNGSGTSTFVNMGFSHRF